LLLWVVDPHLRTISGLALCIHPPYQRPQHDRLSLVFRIPQVLALMAVEGEGEEAAGGGATLSLFDHRPKRRGFPFEMEGASSDGLL